MGKRARLAKNTQTCFRAIVHEPLKRRQRARALGRSRDAFIDLDARARPSLKERASELLRGAKNNSPSPLQRAIELLLSASRHDANSVVDTVEIEKNFAFEQELSLKSFCEPITSK